MSDSYPPIVAAAQRRYKWCIDAIGWGDIAGALREYGELCAWHGHYAKAHLSPIEAWKTDAYARLLAAIKERLK